MKTPPSSQPSLPLEFFQKLPKTDLHVHLDGSLRLETIIELARQHGVELPSTDPAELRQAMNLGQNCGSLVEYLKAFDVTLRVMQHEEALFRVAYELAEDAARENVRYMEVRYSPMLHTRGGLKLTSVVEATLAGLRAGHDALGVESAVILCGIRNISAESSLEMAELAVAYKGRGVVGFDLAGAEYDHPAKAPPQGLPGSSATTTSTPPSTPARPTGRSPSPRPSTSAGATASATACACGRTATSSTTSTITASRWSAAPPPTCRPAPSRDLPCAPPQALLPTSASGVTHQHRQPPRHRHHRVAGTPGTATPQMGMSLRDIKTMIVAGF